MRRTGTAVLAAAALAAGLGMAAQSAGRRQGPNPPLPKVTVYKSPT